MSAIPEFARIRVGQPIRHGSLTVFPLFPSEATTEEVLYLLSDEAVAAGTLTVEEVSESGSVPTLLVHNRGDQRVLFLEGEELRGAKQNRVLNTSVLVGARTKATIPVSCVEQGRWRFRTRHFTPSDSYSSAKLRQRLKSSVSRSLQAGQGHHSDQGAVWSEVARQMSSLGSSSETHAMADTYESHRGRVEEFRARLGYIEGATGLAVAVGPTIVALDLFDKPATCQKIWGRLLSGCVMDALEETRTETLADSSAVEILLKRLEDAPWKESPAVGEGHEFRAEPGSDTHASALTYSSSLLHGSAVLSVEV